MRRTMYMGYHYKEGKTVGYNVTAPRLYFSNVSYFSLNDLKFQLKKDGYKEEEIEVERITND